MKYILWLILKNDASYSCLHVHAPCAVAQEVMISLNSLEYICSHSLFVSLSIPPPLSLPLYRWSWYIQHCSMWSQYLFQT